MPRTLTDIEIQTLHWAFAQNHHFPKWFANPLEVSEYTWIRYAEIIENTRKLPIQNIQHKLSEIGNPEKLPSILSELRAAKVFAERDFKVQLILDNDKIFKSQSPDLLIERENLTIFAEVQKKFGDDELRDKLKRTLTPLLVERDIDLSILYSKNLSELAVNYNERDRKERRFDAFSKNLYQLLENPDKSKLPLELNLDDSKIYIKQSKPGMGRVSFSATSITLVPGEENIQQIRTAIKKKSQKRRSWKNEFPDIPFLIFLDVETAELEESIFPALYGYINDVDWLKPNVIGRKRKNYPNFLEEELRGEQRELLLKLGFDSRRKLHIDKLGAFVDEDIVRANVTGVISMCHDRLECFPNPFCEQSISILDLPELIDIPLVYCPTEEFLKT